MPEADIKSVRVIIKGRVQGVWYRAWTQKTAASLGLDGWVRNRADGTVEAVFSGATDAVDAMLAKCRKGPPLARVTGIDIEPADRPEQSGFETRDTL